VGRDDGLASDERLDLIGLGRPGSQQMTFQRLGRHARQLDLRQALRLELVDYIEQWQRPPMSERRIRREPELPQLLEGFGHPLSGRGSQAREFSH
jgi:hypothetical protein